MRKLRPASMPANIGVMIFVQIMFMINDRQALMAFRFISASSYNACERARCRVRCIVNELNGEHCGRPDVIHRMHWWSPWVGRRKIRAPPLDMVLAVSASSSHLDMFYFVNFKLNRRRGCWVNVLYQ